MNKIQIVSLLVSLMLVMIPSIIVTASNPFINKETRNKNYEPLDANLSFIFCKVLLVVWYSGFTTIAWNVKFEIKDLDTCEIIEEKTRIIGMNLFKFLKMGHDYEIKVTTSYGQETLLIEDLNFFQSKTIKFLI
jgi:hypothetical protein